jgi:hypothetical protein
MIFDFPENFGKKVGRRKNIILSSEFEDSVYNMVTLHNSRFPEKKVTINIARLVVDRGLSGLVEDGIALIRLSNFLSKKSGTKDSRYTEDDDLLNKE